MRESSREVLLLLRLDGTKVARREYGTRHLELLVVWWVVVQQRAALAIEPATAMVWRQSRVNLALAKKTD